MNDHKFHASKVMRSTPSESGQYGSKTNRKHVLLRQLAEQKRLQYEKLKKAGEINQDLPNELEHWLFMYSDYTIERLNNELLKLSGNHTQ